MELQRFAQMFWLRPTSFTPIPYDPVDVRVNALPVMLAGWTLEALVGKLQDFLLNISEEGIQEQASFSTPSGTRTLPERDRATRTTQPVVSQDRNAQSPDSPGQRAAVAP